MNEEEVQNIIKLCKEEAIKHVKILFQSYGAIDGEADENKGTATTRGGRQVTQVQRLFNDLHSIEKVKDGRKTYELWETHNYEKTYPRASVVNEMTNREDLIQKQTEKNIKFEMENLHLPFKEAAANKDGLERSVAIKSATPQQLRDPKQKGVVWFPTW